MVDKNWTSEQVWNAHEAALEFDSSLNESDPTLPLYQWIALKRMESYEDAYNKKDKFYLMRTIAECANHNLPLPPWAAMAFLEGYYSIVNARSGSWDEVFGRPYPKGAHLSAIRKKRVLKFAVVNEINRIRMMNHDIAIDDSLFEEVGKKFGIGKTLASEYYYSCEFVKWSSKQRRKQTNKDR